ncbi:MAG: hypothetical protein DRP95_03430 [Candidatus Latescibacterota bacterium]|nr:MAG: hypothetical protein DRP95_03430 [Candidatus Latescibacterota bacterium]
MTRSCRCPGRMEGRAVGGPRPFAAGGPEVHPSSPEPVRTPVRPAEGEPVVHTGEQLHRLLSERRVLHLFYAGFAANWCLLYRDYGVLAMHGRGYDIILVRDATAGVEFHDTVNQLSGASGRWRPNGPGLRQPRP